MKPAPPAPSPVPLLLLTGFLGSGKTTLLRRWLNQDPHPPRQLGVVMNDFGPVSIDSLLVAQPDLPLETISGGCLCCAEEQSLADAVAAVLSTGRIDVVVVETSGLADPSASIERLVDPAIVDRVQLQGVVTLVDAAATAGDSYQGVDARLWRSQVRLADCLLLSKCDLLSPGEITRVEKALKRLNPVAALHRLPDGNPTPESLLKVPHSRKSAAPRKKSRTVPHAHQSHQTIGFQFTRAANRAALESFLNRLDPEKVVRAKGFVRLRGRPRQWFVFHYVLGRHAIESYSGFETPRPVGVFIGPGLDPNVYRRRLRRVFEPAPPLARRHRSRGSRETPGNHSTSSARRRG